MLATEQRIGVLLVSHQPQEGKICQLDWLGFVDDGKLAFIAPMEVPERSHRVAFAAYLGCSV